MANIRRSPIWPDPSVKPPFGATQINWGHPLVPSSAWFFSTPGGVNDTSDPQNIFDAVTGRRATGNYTAGDFTYSPDGRFGIAFEQATEIGDRYIEFGDSDTLIGAGPNTTIVLGHQKTDTTNRTMGWGCSGTSRCGGHIPYSDGTVYWDFNGSGEGSTRISVGGLSFTRMAVWVFTAGSRGMEIWQDGVLRASHGTNPGARTLDGVQFRNLTANGGSGDLNRWAFLYIYKDRQLLAGDSKWISAEPFIFLQPVIQRRWFMPRAVEAPAGSKVTPRSLGLLGVGG